MGGCSETKTAGGGHPPHGADGAHDDHGDHGDHEEKTEAITVFSARHELFIEHAFLLKGKATKFITHVTDVPARKARAGGPLTFVLQLGDAEPIRYEVPKLARTGIYLPEITFTQAGEWKVSVEIPNADGDDVVQLPNRKVYATEAELHSAPEAAGHDGISFLKEQQWKLDFQTAAVVRSALTERIQLPGRLLAPPSGSAAISPSVTGRLLPPAGGSLPVLGQRVRAGQVLARVRPPLAGSDHLSVLAARQQLTSLRLELMAKAAEARAESAVAKVALRRAAQQLSRVRGLAERKAKSARQVEQAVYEQARAEAELQAAQIRERLYADVERQLGELPGADLSRGFPTVELKAPIAGLIVHAQGAQGEQVAAGAELFRVLDSSKLHLEVKVPETALGLVPEKPDVVFTTPAQRELHRQVLGAGGRLLLGAEFVNPRSRAARLVYEFPNPGDLAAGMAVEAFVASKNSAQALAIPESALVEEDGRYVVFVMLGGETFEKRDLTLGVRDGGRVEVKSGLSEGERVVVRSAYAVKLASVSSSIPAHGHAH